jgi:predicted nucleic acid-binding protein
LSVVDTNVLVHASALTSPEHAKARSALAQLSATGPVAVSRQILREFLSATTRPQTWAKAASFAEATRNTDDYIKRFTVLDDGPQVWAELMALGRRYAFGGKQVHDANIVATMLAYGETRLLTFNGADFQRFASVITVLAP